MNSCLTANLFSLKCWCLRCTCGTRRITRAIQETEVHAAEVLTNDAKGEQLCTRKDRNHRGEKCETGDVAAGYEVPSDNESKHEKAKQGKGESHQAADP